MRYNHILLAVDLRHDVRHLLQRTGKFALRLGAALHLISVLPVADGMSQDGGPDKTPELKRETFAYLEQLAGAMPCSAGECMVECGEVAPEILAAAARVNTDLLVLGSRQKPGLMAWLQESTAEKLLPSLNCDLLILDEDRPFWHPPLTFSLFVDIDDAGHQLLTKAAHFAHRMGADLRVTHVVEPLGEAHLALELEGGYAATLTDACEKAERQLAEWITALPELPERWQVVSGSPGRFMAESLADPKIQLVVVGGARSAHRHLTQGNHLHRLLHEAGDVLILRW